MKSLRILLLVSALAVVAFAVTSFADGMQYTYNGLSASQISDFLYSVDYHISWHTSIAKDGTPYWVITDVQENIKFLLFVYDLNNDTAKFESLQIDASFNLPTGLSCYKANQWNRTKRFGKASLDEDNDPVIEFNLDIFGGVTKKEVIIWIDRAIKVIRSFSNYIGY